MRRAYWFSLLRPARQRGTRPNPATARAAAGSLLIEALVATLVASIFAAGALSLYIDTFMLGNAAQNQIMVASVAQECIDSLRALPYTTVSNNIGQHTLVVNGNPTGDPLLPRPLVEDLQNFVYTAGSGTTTQSGLKNQFQVANNQVTVNITASGVNSLLATVTINWMDTKGTHQYIASTLLVQYGLNS